MDARLKAMAPLFAAVFIDLFSFGLMYPVIVALFHQPAVMAAYPVAVRGIYLSLAFSLFPLGMFFGASLLGDLSDSIGRRRTLLICMAGLGASYLLMLAGVQTGVLLWFLAGRLLSGLMAGTSPIAQATMMDQSTPEERGADMAKVVMVNCTALVCGPAMGGLLGHIDFRLPLLFAMALCAVAFIWIRHGLPADTEAKPIRITPGRAFAVFSLAWRHPVMRGLATACFLFQFGFGIFYIYIMVYMTRVYALSSAELGLFSATMGLGFVVGSTVLYGRVKTWLKVESRVAELGLVTNGALIVAAALPLGQPVEWLLAFVACCANLLAYIGLLTLVSAAADADEQGWALGIGSSMSALAFFLAGLLAAALHVVPLPGLLAAGGVIVIAGVVPLRLATRAMGRASRVQAAG